MKHKTTTLVNQTIQGTFSKLCRETYYLSPIVDCISVLYNIQRKPHNFLYGFSSYHHSDHKVVKLFSCHIRCSMIFQSADQPSTPKVKLTHFS